MSRIGAHFALLGLVATIAAIGANAESPVEKVIALMGKLSEKVEADGKRDAAQYDKYACFCKEQADNKLYAIETSQKEIDQLTAKIELLNGEITTLTTDIQDLATDITDKETEIADAKKARATAHAKYLKVAEETTFAIKSVEYAIKALEESKGDLKGADLDLVQLQSLAAMAPDASAKGVASLLQTVAHGGQEPPAYKFSGNDILAVLASLQTKFKKYKAELDTEEANAKQTFDKLVLNKENQKKFQEQDKGQKETTSEEKTEAKGAAEQDKAEEAADLKADQDFLKEIKADCELKAVEFDQRSKSRADEIQALTKAADVLKTGAESNWKANKKLVGLSKSVKVAKHAVVAKTVSSPSFLQIRHEEKDAAAVRKALQLIQREAGRLHSPILSAASLKVTVGIDNFVKVRQIIKDLVQKLEDDAKAEQTTKDFCDDKMKKETSTRDSKKAEVEELMANLEVAKEEEATLTSEIADLGAGIAENMKAMKEMTELWDVASTDNELTDAEAKEAIAAVQQAIAILNDYYNKGSLLQAQPAATDREGATISDLAPEIAKGEYKGETESSKGIIGMLETILADFQRTEGAVGDKAKEEKQHYEDDTKMNKEDTAAKQASKETKAGELAAKQEEIVDLKDQLIAAKKMLAESEEALVKLKVMCIDGESYDVRAAQRKEEIAALKEALSILENWKS